MKKSFLFIVVLGIVLMMPRNIKAASSVTVVIDPGHGGPSTVESNLGACYNGLVEKDITLKTAFALRDELLKYKNVNVYLTREDDRALDLKERVDFAKAVNADVMVAVHYNASSSHLFYGSEIFVPSKGQEYATGYGLASCIMDKWKPFYSVNKGIKTRIGKNGDYYGVIRNGVSASIPVIILEHGYIDNYHDFDSLNDDYDLENIGVLDAQGIAAYYGLKKNTVKSKVVPTVNVKAPTKTVWNDVTGPDKLSITVNSYNINTGEVKFTLSASEPESKITFYGVSPMAQVDNNGQMIPILYDLSLWGNGNTISASTYVTPGYAGPLYAVCYNNYELMSNVAVALIGQ